MHFEMFEGEIINKYGKDEQNLVDELQKNIAHVKHKPNKTNYLASLQNCLLKFKIKKAMFICEHE